jgi:hypothetical protein
VAPEPDALSAVPALLRCAQRAEDMLVRADPSTYATAWQRTEQVAVDLAAVAGRDDCPPRLSTLLLDCRDRLGSHLLAAERLAEVGHPHDSRIRVLRRGVRGVMGDLLAITLAAEVDNHGAAFSR